MKIKKICPCCNRSFVTEINSKKYCRERCAILALKRRRSILKKCLCQWCGQVFSVARKRKFCNSECRGNYTKSYNMYYKTERKIPVKITVNDVARESKKCGISYGKYVCIKKIR